MRTVSELTLRRAAAMREMGALGLSAEKASILLDIDSARASQIRKMFKIFMPDGRLGRVAWLEKRIVRDFGKIPPRVMAERYGTSQNSINVRVHQLRAAGKLPPVQKPSAHAKVRAQTEANP